MQLYQDQNTYETQYRYKYQHRDIQYITERMFDNITERKCMKQISEA